MDRKIAILGDPVGGLVDDLKKFGFADCITCFTDHDVDGVTTIKFPTVVDTEPKQRNWINDNYRNGMKFSGFLYVIAGNTKILKDPTSFMNQLEAMMTQLDYPVWFNTICDPCNYVMSKYNPRLAISLDDENYKTTTIGSKLLYTSHSNAQVIVYDMANVSDNLLKFDEDFTVPMFFIIEFLARRRNTKQIGQLFYMNQYLTVESEYGMFEVINTNKAEPSTDIMKSEDNKFKSKNINHIPDNNIDIVLEETAKKLKII